MNQYSAYLIPFPVFPKARKAYISEPPSRYNTAVYGGLISCSPGQQKNKEALRPNILVLVADDLGYSDLGCFGGEIQTPFIDSLALNGIRFSRFYTAPMCAPSRAMLLTGNDNHIAGVGRQAVEAAVFGYEGRIMERVATIPDLLREGGYHTYMAGKWHLGLTPEANPSQLGFERSFVLLEGVGNHFNSQGIFGDNSRSHYTADGKAAQWPDGQFSTDVYTDKLLSFIDEHADEQEPFFAYAAYTAPHWPLQVAEKYWKKYEGNYSDGYGHLREVRFEQLKKRGLSRSRPCSLPCIPRSGPGIPFHWKKRRRSPGKWNCTPAWLIIWMPILVALSAI